MKTLTLFSFEGMQVTKTYLLKNTSDYDNIIVPEKRGGIAQLGERLNGIQEVSGSIPLISTT